MDGLRPRFVSYPAESLNQKKDNTGPDQAYQSNYGFFLSR